MKKTIMPETEGVQANCGYCGATIGQISGRTEEEVHAIFDCPKCDTYYCDQCSYFSKDDQVQRCLRCESALEKIS